MAKNTLPVDFKDDVLNEQMGGRRKYRMINNPDGTVSFDDVTTYDQVGSDFGQAQVNATNQAVNESVDQATVIDDQDDLMANTQERMVAGALAVKELIQQQNVNITNLSNTAFKGIEAFNFSGTTDSAGDVKMPDEYSNGNNYMVLFAFVWEYNYMCVPFHGVDPCFCKIIDANSFNPVNGAYVTGVGYALKVR